MHRGSSSLHATSGSWDTGAWEAAIAPDAGASLYADQADAYQPVNDWSGVYNVPPETAAPAGYNYDYDYSGHDTGYGAGGYSQPQPGHPSYQPQPDAQSPMDQSYYAAVYATYAQPLPPEPLPDSSPAWDGPAWQDPYAAGTGTGYHADYETPVEFYGDPLTGPMVQPGQHPQPQAYVPAQAQPVDQYPTEQHHRFHHPEFDTGEFEAVYAAADATDAEYDLLPDGEGRYDAYGYADEYDDADYDDEYDADYEADYAAGYDDDYEEDEDETPVRSRSRGSAAAPRAPRPSASPSSGSRPFGSPAPQPGRLRTAGGRRTLHAMTAAPAAVVGVAAVAVAAVGGLRLPGHTDTAQAEAPAPTQGLENNLLQMRAASAALADRATRSEQRSELSQQSALEKQRLAELAPKYFFPVQDIVMTAGFGDAGARWSSLHTGQDFAVPVGTKVVAVTDGVVTEAGWAGAFGNRVVITHPDGSQTWYCHLNVIKVKSGPVRAGQLIAYSGDTGNSTGPHLHFEYHPPGTPDINTGVPGATTAVNPMPFLKAHGLIP